MAIYTLHYVLFAVTRLVNPYLLLTEAFRALWPNQESEAVGNSNHTSPRYHPQHAQAYQQNELIFAHSILFMSSMIAYAGTSFVTLTSADKSRDHRRYFLVSLASLLMFYGLYLYMENVVPDQLSTGNLPFRTVYTFVLIALTTGILWSQATTASLGDVLTFNHCLRDGKAHDARYVFITHLMIGTVSAAFMMISLSEIFIASSSINSSALGYINLIVVMALLLVALELLSLTLLTTKGPESSAIRSINDHENRHKPDEPTRKLWQSLYRVKFALDEPNDTLDGAIMGQRGLYPQNTCSKALPVDILSVSIKDYGSSKFYEVSRAVDDEEWDNSVDLFYMYPYFYGAGARPAERTWSSSTIQETNKRQRPRQQKQISKNQCANAGIVDIYDKSKFSLYDNYHTEDKTLKQRREIARISGDCKREAKFHFVEENKKIECLSTIEILMSESRSLFSQNILLLALIGSIYHANQYCLMVDYLHHLTHKSPTIVRAIFLSLADHYQPAAAMDGEHHIFRPTKGYGNQYYAASPESRNPNLFAWAVLACSCHLVQSLARVICFHNISKVVLKHGARSVLGCIFIIAVTLPFQFLINPSFMNNWTNLTSTQIVILVLLHLALIQAQVGMIGATVDYLINELTLQHSQQVATFKLSRLITEPSSAAQSTIHGFLRGSFDLLGIALMSAIMLLVGQLIMDKPADGSSSLATFIVAISPVTISLLLLALVCSHQLLLVV